MKTYTSEELKEILRLHQDWLNGIKGGLRANLSDAYLRGANLSDANLSDAYLRGANLSDANLSDANLRGSNLRGADLSDADLSDADLSDANLSDADLSDANLSGADLRYADLRYADLRYANLRGADLIRANLSGVRYNETTAFFALQCPEEGDFIGWKKCRNDVIVKLLITGKRSSATTRKCRCSEATVLKVIGAKEGISKEDSSFIYRVGETLTIANFDENRWKECSTGIHFFITREEAENY